MLRFPHEQFVAQIAVNKYQKAAARNSFCVPLTTKDRPATLITFTAVDEWESAPHLSCKLRMSLAFKTSHLDARHFPGQPQAIMASIQATLQADHFAERVQLQIAVQNSPGNSQQIFEANCNIQQL